MKTPPIRNILVPVDFSKMSGEAIETAKRFARRLGASVHLAHVHEFFYPAGFTPPTPPILPYPVYTYDKHAEKMAARDLNLLARRHEISAVTTHILTGAPAFDEICRLAKELPADLIVMPTHGRTGLKHVILGSTAERVVRHSPCPVFVCRRKKGQLKRSTTGIDTILVPTDFSACSLAGLNYAIAFAEKTAATIRLLHVIHLGWAYTADGFAMYDLNALTKAAEQEAERQMLEFLRAAKFGRVEFETEITTGHPVEEICAFVEKHDVDLIVTSTHGRTGFEHVLIGSTAEQVVRRAACPVLVVPSHPARRAAQLTRLRKRARTTTRGVTRPRSIQSSEVFTRKYRKTRVNPFPERRRTNKFRESHL